MCCLDTFVVVVDVVVVVVDVVVVVVVVKEVKSFNRKIL